MIDNNEKIGWALIKYALLTEATKVWLKAVELDVL